ncbi:hypothetical protein CTI12_AA583410 [Artemisia annua]|uniref:Uncharacterized protein n=1 Tax=Artemisia annua TaxID=35608 RepID=A0A2U1KN59_ARTAN|nr:hypothetical protein CTI12_AA583410 [Artemisia annua]
MNEADLKKCVELGEKHDNVLEIYVSYSVFELHDATSPSALPPVENALSNDDTDSDLEGDYNIFEYDTEEESDTASIDHLSDGEDELYEVRTKRPDPAPKAKSKKMFDENFLTRVYNGLPRDGYAEDDVAPKYNSVSHEDEDKIGDHWPVHNPDIKWKLMKPHLVRTRGRGDGSRTRMYPQGIKPIGYGVSYDPIDGEPMLGDVIGIPRPAWPPEIALSQSQPLPSQENPVEAANEGEIVQHVELHQEEPSPPRRSERIKQIIFKRPPAPGPGLREDDAIEV